MTPNGLINRANRAQSNDKPEGLAGAAADIEIETEPEYMSPEAVY